MQGSNHLSSRVDSEPNLLLDLVLKGKNRRFTLFCFRFRIDNTDHIIDVNVNKKRPLLDYDRISIICPLYSKAKTPNIEDTERYIIYNVNKEEYDTCRIMSETPMILGKCDDPYQYQVCLSFHCATLFEILILF